MSASEHLGRMDALQQNPELLGMVEVTWEDIGRNAETLQEGETDAQSTVGDWPQLGPLGGELPTVQACDLALLPDSLRLLAEDTAERMQVPLDYSDRESMGQGNLPERRLVCSQDMLRTSRATT
jgi:hypothetical protein